MKVIEITTNGKPLRYEEDGHVWVLRQTLQGNYVYQQQRWDESLAEVYQVRTYDRAKIHVETFEDWVSVLLYLMPYLN